MTTDSGRLSGSREPSPRGLGPSGFDPERRHLLYNSWSDEQARSFDWITDESIAERPEGHRPMKLLRLWLAHRTYLNACRNLAKMKAKSAQSSQDYAKRRKAALRHTPRSWVA
jgi:hypothetical protein